MRPGSFTARALLGIAAATAGCAGQAATQFQFGSAALVRQPILPEFANEPAVVLLSADRIEYRITPFGNRTLQQHHEQRLIQDEHGLDYVDVVVPVEDGSRLVMLAARTIHPDGSVLPVETARIMETYARAGGKGGTMRLFRFPAVTRGSVVEYAWTLETGEIETSIAGRTVRGLPVQRYRVDVFAPELRVDSRIEILSAEGQKLDQYYPGDPLRIAYVMSNTGNLPATDVQKLVQFALQGL